LQWQLDIYAMTEAIVEDAGGIAQAMKSMHIADAEVLTGNELDKLASQYKIERGTVETDYSLRVRLVNRIRGS
jgi:hypothetical protein